MADNIAVTPGTGATISADDVGGGVLVQRTKTTFGVGGTATDVSASDPLPVTLATAGATQNVAVTSFPALSAGTALIGAVEGNVADDAASTAKPQIIGGVAVETDGTDPTSVSAEGDAAYARTDRNRRLLVNTAHPNLWSANENNASAQTNNPIKAAPGANLSLYVTDIIISNGATAGTFNIVEDTGGTPVTKLGPIYLGINQGAHLALETPIRITVNKDLGYTTATVTTHTIAVSGYTAP